VATPAKKAPTFYKGLDIKLLITIKIEVVYIHTQLLNFHGEAPQREVLS